MTDAADLRQDSGHKKISFSVYATSIHPWSVPHPKYIFKVERAFDNLPGTRRNKPMDVAPEYLILK